MNSIFSAGAAQVPITPPVGTSLAGYFHDRVAKRVRDDLFARALVMEHNGECIALVSCDLVWVPREQVQKVKTEVEGQIGIPASRVLIAATHTHTGPVLNAFNMPVNQQWLATLAERLTQAICTAFERRRPAEIRVGCGQETQLSFNRLMRLADGTQVFGTGGSTNEVGAGETQRQVVGPAGPIDPEVVVARIVDRDGITIAFVVNFALHVDVIGGATADLISADWPGEMAQALNDIYGDDTVTLFLNGPCGDINHVDYLGLSGAIQDLGREEKAQQLGRALAGIAMNVGEKAPAISVQPLTTVLEKLTIPYLSPDEVEAALDTLQGVLEREGAGAREYVNSMAKRDDLWGETATVPVQSLRIGDLAIVGVPCEYFVSWGLAIKQWSPAPFTMVAELANGWFGYVATWEAIQRGGYGALPLWSRQLAAEAGQRMADCAFVQLQRLWDSEGTGHKPM